MKWVSVASVCDSINYSPKEFVHRKTTEEWLAQQGAAYCYERVGPKNTLALCILEDVVPIIKELLLEKQRVSKANRAEGLKKATAKAHTPEAVAKANAARKATREARKRVEEDKLIRASLPPAPLPKPPLAMTVPPKDDFEVTIRKLIVMCEKMGIESITIQDGKAEIIRSITQRISK